VRASVLNEVNHQLESRMRENRLSGSEGGETKPIASPYPLLSSPVREGAEAIHDCSAGPKGRHKSWRTFGAQVITVAFTPPLRTGLLTAGPADLSAR
jgi:hypothetical protein